MTQGNTSFLYPEDVMAPLSRNTVSAPSAQFASNSNINQGRYSQDTELLKEYGLDFNTLSLRNGGHGLSPSKPILKPVVTDPFEEVERLAKDTQSCQFSSSQSMWTKFE